MKRAVVGFMGIWSKVRRKFGVRRSTEDILEDLRNLNLSVEGFDGLQYENLMTEWRENFRRDKCILEKLNALPFRLKHRWSDADLSDMATDVEVLKICARVAVLDLYDRGRSQSTSDFFENMKYHADAYRLFGFDECDFPYSFLVDSDSVAEGIIKTCKANGETSEEVVARFLSGFDEFAELLRHPVMKKMGVLDRRGLSFIRFMHPRIARVSTQKFQDGYYSDSVESAFKEICVAVKDKVQSRLGRELDGQPLMQRVFSPENPILLVEDNIITQTNRDTQKGYMMMFSGAMSAIRNPKAHENMRISKEDAVRKLMFASMLMYKLDVTRFAEEHE